MKLPWLKFGYDKWQRRLWVQFTYLHIGKIPFVCGNCGKKKWTILKMIFLPPGHPPFRVCSECERSIPF